MLTQKNNVAPDHKRLQRWLQQIEEATGEAFAVLDDNLTVICSTAGFRKGSPGSHFPSLEAAKADGRWEIHRLNGEMPGLQNCYLLRQRQGDENDQKDSGIAALLSMLWRRDCEHEWEVANLSQEIVDRYEELNLFYEFSDELGIIGNREAIREKFVERTRSILKAGGIALWLRNQNETTNAFYFQCDLPGADRLQPFLQAMMQTSMRTRQSYLADSRNEIKRIFREEKLDLALARDIAVSVLVSPLIVQQNCIGSIAVLRQARNDAFSASDQKLLVAMSSMAAVAFHNSRLVEELKKKEIARHELQLAENIQKSLLPQETVVWPGLEVASLYLAANKVGGDYLDYFADERRNLNLVIADVSGHNIGAAIMMAATRALIRSNLKSRMPVDRAIAETNRAIFQDLDRAELFVSAAACKFKPGSRELEIAIAGHNPPLLYHAAQDTWEWLEGGSFFMGLEADLDIVSQKRSLARGDVFFLYTDGLIEATSPSGSRFGMDRVVEEIAAAAELPAREIMERVARAARAFRQNRPFDDDISALVMKVS